MRKTLILTALLAGLSAWAHADLINVAVNGGYTTLTLKDYKDAHDLNKAALTTYTLPTSGWFVAAEGGVSLFPFLSFGPRLEYLDASYEYGNAFGSQKGDLSLTSALLGVNVNIDLPLTGLGLDAGVYGGYGYAVDKGSYTPAGGMASTGVYTGSAFVTEIEAKIHYGILPFLKLELLGGMRFGNAGLLGDGVHTTSTNYDFSGLNAGGGISLGF